MHKKCCSSHNLTRAENSVFTQSAYLGCFPGSQFNVHCFAHLTVVIHNKLTKYDLNIEETAVHYHPGSTENVHWL